LIFGADSLFFDVDDDDCHGRLEKGAAGLDTPRGY
jgi:hypothetical protein